MKSVIFVLWHTQVVNLGNFLRAVCKTSHSQAFTKYISQKHTQADTDSRITDNRMPLTANHQQIHKNHLISQQGITLLSGWTTIILIYYSTYHRTTVC